MGISEEKVKEESIGNRSISNKAAYFENVIQFIRKTYNNHTNDIPLHAPVFNGNEKKYLQECIDSTYVSSIGRYVELFEEQTVQYTGAKTAVACVNGTNALHLALLLVDVTPGTEVITQPLTFIATINAITYCGAIPVFLDVDEDTMGLSPEAMRNWLETFTKQQYNKSIGKFETINITTGHRISACVPVHTFGHPCKIDEIADICIQYNIQLVEDSAESLGSIYKGKHTGTYGEIGIFSFNGNKVITSGGGGMMIFKNESMGKKAKHLSTQAKVIHPWEFIHDKIGYNYRMPNINAALGVAQFEQLDCFLRAKRNLAHQYKIFFDNTEIEYFTEPAYAISNYWLNCILLKDRNERDLFLKTTNENGIRTRPVWQLMTELPMFKNFPSYNIVNAKLIQERLVNIPSSVIL